jgi:hypothetical protein
MGIAFKRDKFELVGDHMIVEFMDLAKVHKKKAYGRP